MFFLMKQEKIYLTISNFFTKYTNVKRKESNSRKTFKEKSIHKNYKKTRIFIIIVKYNYNRIKHNNYNTIKYK